jgi:hypothetical protein
MPGNRGSLGAVKKTRNAPSGKSERPHLHSRSYAYDTPRAVEMAKSEEIDSVSDIVNNIYTVAEYENTDPQFHNHLMKQGQNFVAFKRLDDSYVFGPCKFVGYKNNDAVQARTRAAARRDGPPTAKFDTLLGNKVENGDIEHHFKNYCYTFGYTLSKKRRHYWLLDEIA